MNKYEINIPVFWFTEGSLYFISQSSSLSADDGVFNCSAVLRTRKVLGIFGTVTLI